MRDGKRPGLATTQGDRLGKDRPIVGAIDYDQYYVTTNVDRDNLVAGQVIDSADIWVSPEPGWTWKNTYPDRAFTPADHGVKIDMIDDLQRIYDTSWEALRTLAYWLIVGLSDFYGNRGVNINGYYVWSIFLFLIPQTIQLIS